VVWFGPLLAMGWWTPSAIIIGFLGFVLGANWCWYRSSEVRLGVEILRNGVHPRSCFAILMFEMDRFLVSV
jgi:hypothetical protein